jgi:hypothetical protein
MRYPSRAGTLTVCAGAIVLAIPATDVHVQAACGEFAGESVGTGHDPRDVAIGDFNGDGFPDLATANQFGDPGIHWPEEGDHNISVMIGNGDGTFTDDVWYPLNRDEVALTGSSI